MNTTTISTWGNSQGFRFPKNIMHELGLSIGDKLNITLENKKIILEPQNKKRNTININDLVKNIPKNYKVSEEFDNIIGKEQW